MKFFLPIILLLLFSCSLKQDASKKIRIGFAQLTNKDVWRETMNEEMRREIGFYRDYDIELIIKGSDANSSKQIQDIRELVASGIDVLLVSPKESKSLTPVIEEVYSQGIPVIIIDRDIQSSKKTAFIGGNNFAIGRSAAEHAIQLLGRKGNILEIAIPLNETPGFDRHRGFLEGIRNYPDINIVNTVVRTLNNFTDQNKLIDLIDSTDLIYAHSDFIARNAIEWMEEKKVAKPMMIGIDGLPFPGVEMVINGDLNATFLYPTGGDKAIQLAMNILEDRPFEKYNELATIKIDYNNALTLKHQANQLSEQQRKIDNQREELGEMAYLLERQNTFMVLFTIIIALLFAITTLIFYYLHRKDQALRLLDKKNQTISQQNLQITQQRDKLVKVLKIAEEATETKTRFFTDISHEFRNALSLVIHPINELIAAKEDATVKEKLTVVQKNTQLLSKLSEEILNFEKIENNKYYLNFKTQDLIILIKDVVDSFQNRIQSKGLALTTSIPEKVEVFMDGPAIRKVIRNLLSNAIKYNKPGGRIRLEVKNINRTITVSVSDTGLGIPEKDIPYVFDRFYRVSHDPNTGTGLGLAICKTLLQLHHGKIRVNSQPGTGTTFYFSIPQNFNFTSSARKALIDDQKLIELTNPVNKSRVLIVEDNPELLSIISKMLGRFYRTVLASNGKEAFEKAKSQPPDMVISDIYMPEMDGIELCRQLKREPSTFHIPIILLTAINSEESKIKGFDLGADAYMTKPFNEMVLISQIESLLKSRKRLKESYGNFPALKGVQPKDKKDEAFIEECVRLIHEKGAEESFNLDKLAQHMHLSRSSLYRKIKEITGLKTVDFIKKGKLHYAARLLLTTDLTIGEVAYQSGFNDKKYFSKCFSKEYGKVPSKFRELGMAN